MSDPAKPLTLKPDLQTAGIGKFVAHIDLPSTGAWMVNVRIHRDLQTLEFTKRFELN